MKTLAFLLLSFFICIPHLTFAAGPMVTVDRITCERAQSYVRRFHMYWKATEFDGPIPITFITPVGDSFNCSQGDIPEAHREKTVDDSNCLLGYRCLAG